MSIRLCAAAVVLSAMAMTGLRAHHGIATFDNNKPITIEGTVTAFEWTNPHGYLYLDVVDPQGNVANWRIEFGSIGNMRLRGLTRTTFKPGEKLRVTGPPRLDGFKEMLFRRGFTADGAEVGAPPDQGGQAPATSR